MKVTTSVTKIELDCEERDILRKAIEILKNVNSAINSDNLDYIVDNIDMGVYNSLYDEINRIEDYVITE